MLLFFTAELDSLGSKTPSLAIAELEQALIVSFICANPHNYSALLDDRAASGSELAGTPSRGIYRGSLGPADNDRGAGARRHQRARVAFFINSNEAVGQSPMAFVKEVRLRRARDMLGRTDLSPSVTETALACGFTNLGHFAKDYFKRFGERPSDTIKAGKGPSFP